MIYIERLDIKRKGHNKSCLLQYNILALAKAAPFLDESRLFA